MLWENRDIIYGKELGGAVCYNLTNSLRAPPLPRPVCPEKYSTAVYFFFTAEINILSTQCIPRFSTRWSLAIRSGGSLKIGVVNETMVDFFPSIR